MTRVRASFFFDVRETAVWVNYQLDPTKPPNGGVNSVCCLKTLRELQWNESQPMYLALQPDDCGLVLAG